MLAPLAYISVDIEADGPIPGEYSMVSLGATNISGNTADFYVEIEPLKGASRSAEAWEVSRKSLECYREGDTPEQTATRLLEEGRSPWGAMDMFREWLEFQEAKPVFCSFSTWDWSFVYWYLLTFGGKSPFGHSSLDMKSFYMGRYGGDWRGTSKKAILRNNPDLLRGAGPHTHNALDDAKEQGLLLSRMLKGEVACP